MTLLEAIADARRRAKSTGLDWHVIQIWDEVEGPQHETVAETYFDTHKDVESIYCAESPYKLENIPQYSKILCFLANLIDYRRWTCGCYYRSPYGRVTDANCKRHD